ncbi:carboxypeptidase-like regulatory domain-containing protein [Hymenobacter pini]|uniref:carboxypeptidase-like regulatory domain-containing protein n=1 Tax=Hymenobacter pini TaxID=2880879 RepID=UPI001CF47BEC|nr:carboxypeptidase-like regulatory domain-containing protein [Hymenobacter pini]MCA8832148.1 carboxypeptidase-like regulatory domain-containing protein [Hymenobacter pini]
MRSVQLLCAVVVACLCQVNASAGPVITKKKTAAPAKVEAVQPAATAPRPAAAPVEAARTNTSVTITGAVTGADGMPLPGATVWLTNAPQVVAVTNSAGDFTFTLPSNAAVSISCGYGRAQQQQELLVAPNQREVLFFNLPVAATRRRH